MNDIEYRAWDKINNKMIDNFIINSKGIWVSKYKTCTNTYHCGAQEYGLQREYAIDSSLVMPYIGLKDKTNTKIFEYDIVRFEDKLWILYYKTNVASFVISNGISCIHFNVFDTNEMKIVGNKFRNPKLYAKIRKGRIKQSEE